MVGFSRLMEADEVGTIDRQKRHRLELIDPKIEQHGGRIIKLTGDGMIAEFPSVVEAVHCAVFIQREMETREADVAANKKIQYRIAVNLGDVVFDDHENDVYGDGVNIAARLETLADPGGIIVSGTAYDHLKANVEVGYEDLGERQVKNIETPVRVYRVVPGGEPISPKADLKHRRAIFTATACLILIISAIGIWEFTLRPSTVDAVAFDREELLAMPKGPTLAVLPFINRSDDPNDAYFAEGVSVEIMTRMASADKLRLLGQSSTFAVVKETRDPKEIGNRLAADYILDGHVRRAGERVRISAQLFDATGVQVWGETFDKDLTVENLFDIQSNISQRIAVAIGDDGGAIDDSIRAASARRPPKDLTAYECILYTYGDWFRPNALRRGLECSLEIVKDDPQNLGAWANLAYIYRMDALYGFGITGLTREENLKASEEAAEAAVRIDPNNDAAIFQITWVAASNGDRARVRIEMDRYLSLGWRSNQQMGWMGYNIAVNGRWELGLSIVRKAISLSPGNYPNGWHYAFAEAHLFEGRYDEALAEYRIAEVPNFWLTDMINAAVHALRGDVEVAQQAARDLQERKPGFSLEDAAVFFDDMARDPKLIGRYVEGLRRAGVPDGQYDGRFDG